MSALPVVPATGQSVSAADAVSVAAVARMEADSALVAALGGVPAIYNVQAPTGAVLPYVVTGDLSETPRKTFGRRGSDYAATWHLFDAGPSDAGVLALFAHLFRLFDGQRLAVGGHRAARTDVALVTVYNDPDGSLHGLVRFTAITQVGDDA